jgi:hypothetical protein
VSRHIASIIPRIRVNSGDISLAMYGRKKRKGSSSGASHSSAEARACSTAAPKCGPDRKTFSVPINFSLDGDPNGDGAPAWSP